MTGNTRQEPDALAVVERYLDALATHAHDEHPGRVATEGFRYRSPIANIDNAAAFLEFIMVSGGILQRIRRRHAFVDGADVCHWLVFDTMLSERVSTPAAQWARVEGGRITCIELLFDPYRWRMLFDTRD
jgi:hypothetical protein